MFFFVDRAAFNLSQKPLANFVALVKTTVLPFCLVRAREHKTPYFLDCVTLGGQTARLFKPTVDCVCTFDSIVSFSPTNQRANISYVIGTHQRQGCQAENSAGENLSAE